MQFSLAPPSEPGGLLWRWETQHRLHCCALGMLPRKVTWMSGKAHEREEDNSPEKPLGPGVLLAERVLSRTFLSVTSHTLELKYGCCSQWVPQDTGLHLTLSQHVWSQSGTYRRMYTGTWSIFSRVFGLCCISSTTLDYFTLVLSISFFRPLRPLHYFLSGFLRWRGLKDSWGH